MNKKRRRKKQNIAVYLITALAAAVAAILLISGLKGPLISYLDSLSKSQATTEEKLGNIYLDPAEIPEYSGSSYTVINENIPQLDKADGDEEFEIYASRDAYGRCRGAYANVSPYTMPDKPRESIGNIRPTGWHLIKYEGIEGNYLYNRCHLIGYQLTGENANPENLITGTRYLNTIGMLPFENVIADYINVTGNHVLYKVVPVFTGDNMLASGVWMQALSVEDDAMSFNVYCYNVQPGIWIDYATGDSEAV